MHRTAVVTDQEPTVGKHAEKRMEVEAHRVTAFQRRRLVQCSRFGKPEHIDPMGLPKDASHKFRESIVTPAPCRDTCAGVDADENGVHRESEFSYIRSSRGPLSDSETIIAKLAIRRFANSFQQMQPNIGAMGTGQIRNDAICQKTTAAGQAISDSPGRTTEPE